MVGDRQRVVTSAKGDPRGDREIRSLWSRS